MCHVQSQTRNARKALVGLTVLLAMLFGFLAFNVYVKDKSWKPGLGLDLAGGEEIILTPDLADGAAAPDLATLQEAVKVMRNRVDGSGVAEAEITIQGGKHIIVSLPGTPEPKLLELVKTAAQLQFRPVLYVDAPNATALPTSLDVDPLASIADNTNSSLVFITPAVRAAWAALDCTDPEQQAAQGMGDYNGGYVTCAKNIIDDGTASWEKLIMGPVEMTGSDISRAISVAATNSQGNSAGGGYEVDMEFTNGGQGRFGDITRRLTSLYNADQSDANVRYQFAMVLDGVVISHPTVREPITQGRAKISRGNGMTKLETETLADQLKYGALPIDFKVSGDSTVSASVGADQLQKGLLAGIIGLILVAIYSLLQYRALAFVTIGSLIIAGTLTYGVIGLFSNILGYRLSLAGVTGLVVSIGITADSFIVYFERVRDELREGRSLQAAVDHGWSRARRTIFASDAVSGLAALVLYMTSVGSVRGFAFTLGLTTIIDLIVVTRFTHPILILLARTKFFGGGHQWSGLDPRTLGVGMTYKGRGRVDTAQPTLAERKAAIQRGEL